jgi:hypothetical protein
MNNNNNYWQQTNMYGAPQPQRPPQQYTQDMPINLLLNENQFANNSMYMIPQETSRIQNVNYDRSTLLSHNISQMHSTTNYLSPSYVEPSVRTGPPKKFTNMIGPSTGEEVSDITIGANKNKRKNTEMGESKSRDLVFKGFTLEPDSKKIRFVNSERKKDGINGMNLFVVC